jgi:hypothetical protein
LRGIGGQVLTVHITCFELRSSTSGLYAYRKHWRMEQNSNSTDSESGRLIVENWEQLSPDVADDESSGTLLALEIETPCQDQRMSTGRVIILTIGTVG